VTIAVQERLERLRAGAKPDGTDDRAREILAIAARMRDRLGGRPLVDQDELLYDEAGLPR
jgi:hypothetical protein